MAAPDNPAPVIPRVVPEEDSRLSQLLAHYEMAKAEAAKADEALETIKTGIKVELNRLYPNHTKVDVVSPHIAQPLRLAYVERTTVDAKRLKAESPELFAHYASTSGSWQLRGVR